MSPKYRHVYRLTTPQRVVDILRVRWVQITCSRSAYSDHFVEHTENTDRTAECLGFEYGIRVQVGKWSTSFVVRNIRHMAAHERVAFTYAVAE